MATAPFSSILADDRHHALRVVSAFYLDFLIKILKLVTHVPFSRGGEGMGAMAPTMNTMTFLYLIPAALHPSLFD